MKNDEFQSLDDSTRQEYQLRTPPKTADASSVSLSESENSHDHMQELVISVHKQATTLRKIERNADRNRVGIRLKTETFTKKKNTVIPQGRNRRKLQFGTDQISKKRGSTTMRKDSIEPVTKA